MNKRHSTLTNVLIGDYAASSVGGNYVRRETKLFDLYVRAGEKKYLRQTLKTLSNQSFFSRLAMGTLKRFSHLINILLRSEEFSK